MRICSSSKIVLIIFFLFINSTISIAQEFKIEAKLETAQILEYFRGRKDIKQKNAKGVNVPLKAKCGMWIHSQLIKSWKNITISQKKELSTLLQPDTMQCETVIGHFRIHFDTTGIRTPALLDHDGQEIPNTWRAYVDSVGRIFNYIWEVQISDLGFTPPPLDNSLLYDIYIKKLNNNEYGETVSDVNQPINSGYPSKYKSYIEIDNSYKPANRYTIGMNALKVTAAHEFQHAIQIGSYGFRTDELYAYEITSTWIEDFIYPEINDYFQYLKDYFGDESRSWGFWNGWPFFSGFDLGYERAIWGHFVTKRFGKYYMRQVWEMMPMLPFIESTESILYNYNTDLKNAFSEFTKWNYYTADRANTDYYFSEGDKYPRFQPLQKTMFSGSYNLLQGSVYSLSSSMYEFSINGNVVTAIIANVNTSAAKLYSNVRYDIQVSLSSSLVQSPSQNVMNDLKIYISENDTSQWRNFILQKTKRPDAAPNPFRLADAQNLFLPINDDKVRIADVYFYNSAFDLALYGQFKITYNELGGTRAIEIPASAARQKLNSGIYFIVAKTTTAEYKWKIAVIK